LKCVYASSEVAGLAKTGGLGDVSAALPRALARLGHECCVVMPFYHRIRAAGHPLTQLPHVLNIPVGARTVTGSVWQTALPGSNVPVYLISQPDYFDRDEPEQGRELYQYVRADGRKVDYPDNCSRFVFFCQAILELLPLLDFWPDVLHANDWHTGLVPVYLREIHQRPSTRDTAAQYRSIRSLFTIHNIAYQGFFGPEDYPVTVLPWSLFNHHQLEFYGGFNFLKGGVVFADQVTTVSPTHAREIQTPYFGCGLQGALTARGRDLVGIINGVDYSIWDPATDRYLPTNYTPATVVEGKAACKRFVQERLHLPLRERTPVLGLISRLAWQKGLDLVIEAAEALLREDVQLLLLGEGDATYQRPLRDLQQRHPDRMTVDFEFNEELAHQIEAGADLFLMPSLYEPCGLNQLYSLKYGTVPVVRRTGGLTDTVVDATAETLQKRTATGFQFTPPSATALLEALHRALVCYHEQPDTWLQIQRTGMSQDWSWEKSATEYERLYRKLTRGMQ
jgi:starch synthase